MNRRRWVWFSGLLSLVGLVFAQTVSSQTFTRDPKTHAVKIGEIQKHLDAKKSFPYQVFIEVTIVEVFIRSEDKIGFIYDILGEVGEIRGNNLAGDPVVESNLGVLGRSNRNALMPSGANIVSNIFEGDDGMVRATLQALAEEKVVKVLANPNILTVDGVTARYETGEDVPYLERKVAGNNEVFSSKFAHSGVTLEITPQVLFFDSDIMRENPHVRANVYVQMSSISRFREEEGFTQPIVDERVYQGEPELKAGARVIVSSLYRDAQDNTVRGVPILKDIPLLGRLFRSTSNTSRISQLYVIIKPTIYDPFNQDISGGGLPNPNEESKRVREALDEYTEKIEGQTNILDEFREIFFEREAPQ